MPSFSGRLLLADDVLEGTVEVEAGRVVGWREGDIDRKATARGWIVPSLANAHTHVADAFARGRPGKPATVAELVGPGGWKSKQLAAARPDEVRAGVLRYVDEMAAVGTSRFIDFREGGLPGVRLLRNMAAELAVPPVILGRPLANTFDPDEAAALLAEADGIGLSARRDFARSGDVEAWSDLCRKGRKPFALHASEAHEEDIDSILGLQPSFLVHCTRALRGQLEAVADAGVTVVVCPRSNAHYGMKTPLDRMLAAGVTVAVGTDNGMLNDGDLLAELAQLKFWFPAVSTQQLLRMATWHARALAGPLPRLPPRAGDPADLVVLPPEPFAASSAHKPGFAGRPAPTAAPAGSA
ncbi:MAG: amidohydrolase family protein [Thermoplasmatota archaeon]